MKKETRTKTVKETVYIASDGKEFSGHEAEFKCVQYEAKLTIKNKTPIIRNGFENQKCSIALNLPP